jgi:SAM-dependent methyltransferase
MADDRYLEPYRQSAQQHGTDFRVTLWANEASQRRRFELFAEMAHLSGKRILDAGCSRGDLAAFLLERRIAFGHYVGIDALPEVIAFASSRNLPRSTFHCADFVHDARSLAIGKPQVICISGALNTMDDATVLAVLENAWSATSQTLMFNFLSDRAGPMAPLQDTIARRLDTMRLLDWALSHTWSVAFRQDYFNHGHDATIAMHKP